MGLNIKTRAVAETGKLHLKDAEGDLLFAAGPAAEDGTIPKLPVEVIIFGPGSTEYSNAMAKRQAAAMARLRKGKRDPSGEENRQENAAYLAALTERFINLDYDGLTGRDLALAVYGDRSIGFIADQVAEFVGDWENFTRASTTN